VVIPAPAVVDPDGRSSPPPTAVLVVDDQAPFRSAARALVGLMRGWRVVAEAETGEDALRLADELRPDVVLMDINLPGRNGIELTRDLLALHPSAAVVLVSTYAADDLPPGADSCGAVGYLRKEELTPRVLRELVTERLGSALAQDPVAATGAVEGSTAGAEEAAMTTAGMRPRTDVPVPGAEMT
jgi:two-component system, NarL family, invasion response regulator UvrY